MPDNDPDSMDQDTFIDNWTVNMSTDEGVSLVQLEYLSLLILFSAVSVISLMAFFSWYVVWRLEREWVRAHLDDLEAARRRFSIENLDQAVPARTYKTWKAETEDAGNSADRSSTFLLCVICFQTLQDGDMVRRLPCGHMFHSNCITKWFLKQHDTCPLCKSCYMPRERQPI